ncbi:DNA polymerase III subunit beta [Mesorhizobium silamurunense]|uniref:DNA polymerase III subunit beta n=1 Tax=Mesorhizobium silamurunense TaxID=499528 RepID=UPI00177F052B|nr:DNA polymerase III subunit beta [Mesorhizobium silamurunense]
MKFTVEASAMSAALAVASKITERRNTIPILSNAYFDATGDRVLIKCTDLDLEISLTVSAKVATAGKTTVPAHLLADMMRKVPAGSEAAFDIDQQMAVKAGRSSFKMHVLPAEDFPVMGGADYGHTIEMTGEALHRLFASVQFAISTEETRYYLNGIFFHAKAGDKPTLRAVATDGHRLAKMEIPLPAGADGMPGVIIPRKTVAEIVRLSQGVSDNVTLEVSDTKIRFTAGKTVIVSKLIDGTFPDYERVIPALSNSIAKVDAKTLAISADRVATISTERGRAVKFDVRPGTLTLSVVNPDAGDAMDAIDLDYDAEPIQIGFNSKYLIDALGALPDRTARISLIDAGSPTRFTAESDTEESFLVVLMPMRI